jgi:hypothetical protein
MEPSMAHTPQQKSNLKRKKKGKPTMAGDLAKYSEKKINKLQRTADRMRKQSKARPMQRTSRGR